MSTQATTTTDKQQEQAAPATDASNNKNETNTKKRKHENATDKAPQSKKSRRAGKNENKPQRPQKWYSVTDFSSALFEKYYSAQPFFSQEELQATLETLRNPLPITFRINPIDTDAANAIRDKFQNYFAPLMEKANIHIYEKKEYMLQQLRDLDEERKEKYQSAYQKMLFQKQADDKQEKKDDDNESDEDADFMLQPRIEIPANAKTIHIAAPTPLPYYPNNYAWKLTVGKTILRKHPILRELRDYINLQTSQGLISRQEAVSMLPPLMFTMHGNSQILDMCAAPGSKTAQLLESLALAAKQEQTDANQMGFVIANDNDTKRCYLLSHQLQRLQTLFPHVMITNHDATLFPNVPTTATTTTSEQPVLRLNRILCDVVCSGDGTLRKSPDLWQRWKPSLAWSLHPTQIRIAMRAFHLLHIGSDTSDLPTMVYSTCSLNPVEDEAVVVELIKQSQGQLELVDCKHLFPGLNYSPGVNTWTVMDNDGVVYDKYAQVPEALQDKLLPSMFPPQAQDDGDGSKYQLQHCMRVLPHRNDTGGFFLALLRKKPKPTTTTTTTIMNADQPQSETAITKNKKPNIRNFKGRVFSDEGLQLADSKSLDEVSAFYGLDNVPYNQFFSRTGGNPQQRTKSTPAQKLYFANVPLSQLVHAVSGSDKWKVINAGLRAFEYSNIAGECPFRVTQEGAEWFANIMKKRCVVMPKPDFFNFLKYSRTQIDLYQDATCKQLLQEFANGGLVVRLQDTSIACSAIKNGMFLLRHVEQDWVNAFLARQ